MKRNKKIDNLINDYVSRGHLPERTTLNKAKNSVNDVKNVPILARRIAFGLAALILVVAAFISVASALELFPVEPVYAQNGKLKEYIEGFFGGKGVVRDEDCFDVVVRDTKCGSIITMYADFEGREYDELRIIIEYSKKYELADSRFKNLPLIDTVDEVQINAVMVFENDAFLTLAAFSADNIRICAEIKSTGNIREVDSGSFDVYTFIFIKWCGFAKLEV